MIEPVLFWVLAPAAAGCAVMVIVLRNAVASAIFLIITLLCLAGIYLLLRAPFIAVIQVLVYAGAIMVLFLFVIMLLNPGREKRVAGRFDPARLAGVVLGAVLLVQFGIVFGSIVLSRPGAISAAPEIPGNTEAIARLLFTDYLLAFEITSVPLLAAIIGAIILAKRKP